MVMGCMTGGLFTFLGIKIMALELEEQVNVHCECGEFYL
ncbi:hypothetical protein VIC_003842 [Vibrio coralliilyticus ATCC BAA-450]|nr:hypothetical protein VIC_003842 [Vibrio coralliilyticus ATCC BAA-450]